MKKQDKPIDNVSNGILLWINCRHTDLCSDQKSNLFLTDWGRVLSWDCCSIFLPDGFSLNVPLAF